MKKFFIHQILIIIRLHKKLAQDYGITQQTMNNYMRIAKSIPELEDLVDTGIVTKLYIYLFEQYICDTLKSCMRRYGR